MSPDWRDRVIWYTNALSFSESVTLSAVAILPATLSTVASEGVQTKLHESAATASVVADFSANAAEKKFSMGTDRKASSPASIVLTASRARR